MALPIFCRRWYSKKADSEELCKQASFFDRRELGAKLNAIMVVKSDITINEYLCFMDGLWFVKTNAFGFENGKEIFAMALPYELARLDMEGVMPYCVVK